MPTLPSTPEPSPTGAEADPAATSAASSDSGSDSDSDSSTSSVPPWVSVFILLGALFALVAMFSAVCWVARSVIINRSSGRSSETQEAAGDGNCNGNDNGEDEVVAQKMRQLDESAPAKTYKAWKTEVEAEDGPAATGGDGGHNQSERGCQGVGDVERTAQSTSFLVCVICLETLRDVDLIRHLSCGHIYHSDCIIKWYLKQHDTCPLCKTYYVPHEQDPLNHLREGEAGGGGHGGRQPITRQQAALFQVYQTVSI